MESARWANKRVNGRLLQTVVAGIPRAEALREAQLAKKEKYLDPYYWRAFICRGIPGPFSSQNYVGKICWTHKK